MFDNVTGDYIPYQVGAGQSSPQFLIQGRRLHAFSLPPRDLAVVPPAVLSAVRAIAAPL